MVKKKKNSNASTFHVLYSFVSHSVMASKDSQRHNKAATAARKAIEKKRPMVAKKENEQLRAKKKKRVLEGVGSFFPFLFFSFPSLLFFLSTHIDTIMITSAIT